MRTLVWKLIFLILCGVAVEGPWDSSKSLLALTLISIPVLFALVFLCMMVPGSGEGRFSILPARISTLFLLPALTILLAFRVGEEPPMPPSLWFHFDRDNPDYDHRIRATADIEEAINPGLYIARIRLHGFERDLDPSFHGKNWKPWPLPGPAWGEYRSIERTRSFFTAIKSDLMELYPGCRVEFQVFGRGVPTRPTGGFGEFLAEKGAFSYIRVYQKWHVLDHSCPNDLRGKVRGRMFHLIDKELTESAGIAKAMLLGDSGWMSKDTKFAARKLGILHLFAASGLHLGIFYGVFFLPLAFFLGRKHPVSLFLPLLPAAFYLWLLFFPVTLSRAFFFLLLFAARSVIHRPVRRSHHLTNTAWLLLLWDPVNFYSLSCLLSFSAVVGILYLYKPIEKMLFGGDGLVRGFLRSQIALTLSASAFISPILVWTFGESSASSHLSNILLVPYTGFALPPVYILIALQAAIGEIGPLPLLWGWACSLFDGFAWMLERLSTYALFVEYSQLWNLSLVLSVLAPCLVYLGILWKWGAPWIIGFVFLMMFAAALPPVIWPGEPFFGELHYPE